MKLLKLITACQRRAEREDRLVRALDGLRAELAASRAREAEELKVARRTLHWTVAAVVIAAITLGIALMPPPATSSGCIPDARAYTRGMSDDLVCRECGTAVPETGMSSAAGIGDGVGGMSFQPARQSAECPKCGARLVRNPDSDATDLRQWRLWEP